MGGECVIICTVMLTQKKQLSWRCLSLFSISQFMANNFFSEGGLLFVEMQGRFFPIMLFQQFSLIS